MGIRSLSCSSLGPKSLIVSVRAQLGIIIRHPCPPHSLQTSVGNPTLRVRNSYQALETFLMEGHTAFLSSGKQMPHDRARTILVNMCLLQFCKADHYIQRSDFNPHCRSGFVKAVDSDRHDSEFFELMARQYNKRKKTDDDRSTVTLSFLTLSQLTS
jgi:hypothetical protein